MCFGATASFVTGGVLIPLGVHCVRCACAVCAAGGCNTGAEIGSPSAGVWPPCARLSRAQLDRV